MQLGAIVAVGLSLLAPVPTVAARAWFAVLAASGLMLLAVFVRSALNLVSSGKNTGEAVFVLWAPAVLLFFITVADMINARYILLALPALYLVVFRQATRAQLLPAIGATALLALALAYADMRLVNSYREWADNTIPPLQRQGFRVWNAAESGLRFYVERTGAATLSAKDERPAGTDLIVRHGGRFVPFRYGLSERCRRFSKKSLSRAVSQSGLTTRQPARVSTTRGQGCCRSCFRSPRSIVLRWPKSALSCASSRRNRQTRNARPSGARPVPSSNNLRRSACFR